VRKKRSSSQHDLSRRWGRAALRTLAPALLLFATLQTAQAQLGVTTFGIQLKPVIPFGFFDPVTTLEQGTLASTVELKGGMAFGMVVRTGLTKAISLEVGIDQITRRYDVTLSNDTNAYNGSTQIRFVGYEVPVTCLVYIRLGEKTWMNNALGLSMDFYPSDAVRNFDAGQVYYYRRNWAQRPFQDLALAEVIWTDQYQNYRPYSMSKFISGSYLTVDLRYYFHEDPDKDSLLRFPSLTWAATQKLLIACCRPCGIRN
jgi:hypothetical protein